MDYGAITPEMNTAPPALYETHPRHKHHAFGSNAGTGRAWYSPNSHRRSRKSMPWAGDEAPGARRKRIEAERRAEAAQRGVDDGMRGGALYNVGLAFFANSAFGTAVEALEVARAEGVDAIVVDHHRQTHTCPIIRVLGHLQEVGNGLVGF